jgi:mRNA interferase RelE/StbE
MTDWTVQYHRDLEKEIRRLPKQHIRRILEAIENLSNDPHPPGSKKIQGYDLWRVQVSVYRIIYQIDNENKIVNTYRIGHRKGVYRNL